MVGQRWVYYQLDYNYTVYSWGTHSILLCTGCSSVLCYHLCKYIDQYSGHKFHGLHHEGRMHT